MWLAATKWPASLSVALQQANAQVITCSTPSSKHMCQGVKHGPQSDCFAGGKDAHGLAQPRAPGRSRSGSAARSHQRAAAGARRSAAAVPLGPPGVIGQPRLAADTTYDALAWHHIVRLQSSLCDTTSGRWSRGQCLLGIKIKQGQGCMRALTSVQCRGAGPSCASEVDTETCRRNKEHSPGYGSSAQGMQHGRTARRRGPHGGFGSPSFPCAPRDESCDELGLLLLAPRHPAGCAEIDQVLRAAVP